MLPGRHPALYVPGEVVTDAGSLLPKLKEAGSPGADPTGLMLELAIEQEPMIGIPLVACRPPRFETLVTEGVYSQVSIRFGNCDVATIDVDIVH